VVRGAVGSAASTTRTAGSHPGAGEHDRLARRGRLAPPDLEVTLGEGMGQARNHASTASRRRTSSWQEDRGDGGVEPGPARRLEGTPNKWVRGGSRTARLDTAQAGAALPRTAWMRDNRMAKEPF